MRTVIRRSLLSIAFSGWLASLVAAQASDPVSVFTDAQADAGKAAYESVCVNCHTYRLTGRKGEPDETPAVESLPLGFQQGIQNAKGQIPALAGQAFINRWGGRTTQALSVRITVAIGGFPPAGLDTNTANNLAAYFLKMNGAAAGNRAFGSPGTLDVLIGDVAAGQR